ncbi:adenosine kinase [Calycomorphotria hydatis]|uniref:5-dehydro-2-deoxygluconokinase n=1 Tax=Calycomorphotria hydatis TaxID=2528027 RepID=A0A517TB17_9PLAN|nr:adenosine kinase [Calycomorphotria hydatis]QDT65564.1 5-dehydro-2-deoxygluconokinase [Calycomorphotria hydatis]
MPYDVYGLGNALVDIQARVPDDLVQELRFAKGMMTLVDEDTQIKVLNSLDGADISRCAGASAANTIAGIADFGGNVAYTCKVADDELGDFFLEDMRKLGVAIEVAQASDRQTGTCVILITPDAERTMLTHLGVSGSLSAEDIDETEVAQADYIYIEGYLFTGESTREAALHCIDVAVRNNVKVAFTVSDPFLIHQYRNEFLKLIEGPVDLLFCNEEEAQAMTTLNDPIECAQELHRHCRNVAMTLGANGSIIMHGGEVIPIEGVKVNAIDTTGAGDMYAAGLLYGVTNGLSWKQAGHLASHAAGKIVAQMGARLKKPFTPKEIATIVAEA